MIALCVIAGLGAPVVIDTDRFTLVWSHTVERIEWQEHYSVSAAGLRIEAASVGGSGAGMEPPDDAVWRDGRWHYRPRLGALAEVVLSHSGFGEDYRLCWGGWCRSLSAVAGSDAGPLVLRPCAP